MNASTVNTCPTSAMGPTPDATGTLDGEEKPLIPAVSAAGVEWCERKGAQSGLGVWGVGEQA